MSDSPQTPSPASVGHAPDGESAHPVDGRGAEASEALRIVAACPCSNGAGVKAAIVQDLDRVLFHLDPSPGARARRTAGWLIRAVIFFPGLFAVLLYRIAHLMHTRLPGPLTYVAWIPTRLSGILIGVNFSPAMHAGPGLLINHTGNVFLGPISIGSNCNVSHGVTVGQSTTNDRGIADVATIGHRVWIGPNAVVSGQVNLGDDSSISALTLVTRDVPARALVVGVPGRIMPNRGSFRQVRYYGMDSDPARIVSLRQVTEASQPA